MKIALIILGILFLALIVWLYMIKKARRFYEEMREDLDLYKDAELIAHCNYALDRANSQHIYFHYRLKRLKEWIFSWMKKK